MKNWKIQKDSGLYERILFEDSSGGDSSNYTWKASLFDPEITPRLEIAAVSVSLSTSGTAEYLTVTLDPANYDITLPTGDTQKVLACEILFDPGIGYDLLFTERPFNVTYTLGGSA